MGSSSGGGGGVWVAEFESQPKRRIMIKSIASHLQLFNGIRSFPT
jgi:hypothetical protein